MYLSITDPQEYTTKTRSAMEQISGDQAKPFIEQRLRLAEMAAAYQDGQWVPLTGTWKLALSHMLRTQGPREIEWSVLAPSPSPEKAPPGLQMGPARSIWNDRTDPGVLFFADPVKNRLGVFRNGKEVVNKQVYQTPKRIRVKAWGPGITMDMDGRSGGQRETTRSPRFMSWSALEAC